MTRPKEEARLCTGFNTFVEILLLKVEPFLEGPWCDWNINNKKRNIGSVTFVALIIIL